MRKILEIWHTIASGILSSQRLRGISVPRRLGPIQSMRHSYDAGVVHPRHSPNTPSSLSSGVNNSRFLSVAWKYRRSPSAHSVHNSTSSTYHPLSIASVSIVEAGPRAKVCTELLRVEYTQKQQQGNWYSSAWSYTLHYDLQKLVKISPDPEALGSGPRPNPIVRARI